MGEAKRRKVQDPDYGKTGRKTGRKTGQAASSDNRQRQVGNPPFSLEALKNISTAEWIVWAVLFGGVLATFLGTYRLE